MLSEMDTQNISAGTRGLDYLLSIVTSSGFFSGATPSVFWRDTGDLRK